MEGLGTCLGVKSGLVERRGSKDLESPENIIPLSLIAHVKLLRGFFLEIIFALCF